MISSFLTKIFGSRNQRLLKQYQRRVEQINALEATVRALSDEALRAKTAEFKQRHANGESLDALLPEAFAVVREAARRTLGMRHFDVQLIGGMVLHDGKIAEMRTGEGKTLTATLAVYLNALTGKGVHVVTVNDYLASRDAEWMGKVYRFLGMSVGVILSQQSTAEKRAAYAADITYGTNNEFGFDYLRDNMEYSVADRRQRGLVYAIVDEVDSILIDEARTPLIISGPAEDHTELYRRMNEVVPLLTRQKDEKSEGDFWVDEKAHQVHLSEAGHEKVEGILVRMGLLAEGESLYAPQNIVLMHHLNAALRAHHLFHRDQHYVVQNGEVIIVDEFTGRLMPGRRWSDGLHQAVEAKEGVPIQQENQTLASITFQNYFRMYQKLAGMTGTADTEAYEFQEIYRLEVVVIPTHKPMIRIDHQDKVYRTVKEKYAAIIADIKDCYARGQPVLVGTTSIENSEVLSRLLQKEGLPHQVLNAKQHAREAEIVAQAGRPKMITIATNMAGRGTDIVLGGNIDKQIDQVRADPNLTEAQKEERIAQLRAEWQKLHDQVVAAGGLKIIGSERHESRRIDNQLRGRAGRQGDPGESRFYLSMEDPLLRIFAGDRMRAIMDRLKLPEGEAIEAGIVTRSIENAQRKVEARNFDIRKQLLEYDDVANEQRREIYRLRNEILEAERIDEMVDNLRRGFFTDLFRSYVPAESVEEQWDIDGLTKVLAEDWQLQLPIRQWLHTEDKLDDETILARILKAADEAYAAKVAVVGREVFAGFERSMMLQVLDQHWREHLAALDHLRQGIHLRGYAQKQPKQEYKREAFELFGILLDRVRADVVKILMNVRIQTQQEVEAAEQRIERESERLLERARAQHTELGSAVTEEPVEVETLTLPEPEPVRAQVRMQPVRRLGAKVGRNDPCPCGSGKKYKQCHGKLV
ncbi:MAG: preprotein translocase subunit SecA [Sutterellaceae bacterium]|nr:preprotein translocase subunit SecA [Burkholderiaceae bacterium]MDW8429375.1 preprotein translocase subunit SecA [Sutterellaceae bacterium]